MKKYQRMHPDFYQTIHQANHGIQGGFCGWGVGSFSDSRLEPLVSQCHLSTHPSLEGWTFQEIAFIYGFSLIPKGLDHLFLTISGL